MFDTGKVRTKETPKTQQESQYAAAHINEQTHTGLIIYKKATTQRNEDSLLEAKTHIETVLSTLGLNEKIIYQPTQHSYFHPKKQADILYQ